MHLNTPLKALFAGVSGTALQWYDFALFGYFAPIIAQTYFPSNNPIASMLSAFGVFAVGYFLAPLGSLVFGYVGDRFGRKRALSWSILAMAIATFLISVLPGYERIGLVAPIAITLFRLIQGFVASSEFTGSAIFLVEHAKPERRALYGSLTSSGYSVGVIFAGIIASFLSASFMPDWAWRIGFAMAMIAGLVIYYLRQQVTETPVFLKMLPHEASRAPFFSAIQMAPFAFFGVIGLGALVGIMTYGTYVFTVSYFHVYFDMTLSFAALIVSMALVVDALLEPLVAMLSDKIGHLRVLMVGMVLMLVLSLPVFYLFSMGDARSILLGMVLMSTLIAIAFAPLNVYMVELFPKGCRYSGFGVAFHIGISLFGGTAPIVMMQLVQKTDNVLAPAIYYIIAALVGLVSLVICEMGRRELTPNHLITTAR